MAQHYTSLHNYSSFSIMRGLSKPLAMFEKVKELGQTSLAITDYTTLAGMWDALKASKQTGVKLIAGCEVNFVDNVTKHDAPLRTLVLLAKNSTGYKNLLVLNKLGYDNFIISFKKATPRIDWNLLEQYKEGLICLSGGGNGLIAQHIMANDLEQAKNDTKKLIDIFGDNFGLELQPNDLKRRETPYGGAIDQNLINRQLRKIGIEFGCRCIVATGSLYTTKEEHRAHDVLLAIGSGQPLRSQSRITYNVNDFYIKSADEAEAYFTRHESYWGRDFIDSLFDNVKYFDELCENPEWIDPKFSNPSGKELPEFPVKDQSDYNEFLKWKKDYFKQDLPEDVLYLRYKCEIGFAKKVPAGKEEEYRERLKEELDVFEYHGFSSYMLIVADIIEYAIKNNIRVGCGRGSVGGSLVAYFLDIHVADPIKYKLIFARFHNKEKTSFPDIDMDFPSYGQECVRQYIRKKYGEDYVACVSNVNTITPKVYVRDIARVFEFVDGKNDAVKIGNDIADTISKEFTKVTSALEGAPLFAEYAKQYPELAEFAASVGGKARAWSTHAGGIVIGKRPLVGLVPLRRDTDGVLVLEYDKDRAEENGLVKMDTLAISTLDIIDEAYRLIAERGKELPPDPPELDDKDTYSLISQGNTFGVFQLGGTAQSLCKMVRPQTILDISYINSLLRPAAKNIREDFVKTRDGLKPVELMHPLLERAFGDTYGYGLFEECLFYLAQDVAGWDLHYADRLRKLTKEKGKNPEKAKAWRKEFINDAITNKNLDKGIATKIWDDVVAEFGGYGFNASHSLFYAITAYYTAYLKAHYPLEFLVANLKREINSNAPAAKDNVNRIKDEIRSLGVRIISPDINTSDSVYKIIDDKTIMTGLNSMKYMGEKALPDIIEKRPFKSLDDFLERIDGKKLDARGIQALAASGALDSFGINRKLIFYYASDYKKKFGVHIKKPVNKRGEFNYPWPDETPWTPKECYALEKYYLGEGISGTVYERYEKFFDKKVVSFADLPKVFKYKQPLGDDEKENRKRNTYYCTFGSTIPGLKGIVTNVFSFKVKKEDSKIRGEIMARITVQDPFGNELTVLAFPDAWKNAQERIEKELSCGKHKFDAGIAIYFTGNFQYENEYNYIFILSDIIDYKEEPELPTDLKSRKIKMPRGKSLKEEVENIENLNQNELIEVLENKMTDEGYSFDDEDDDEDPFDI